MKNKTFLESILNQISVSGHEENIQKVIKEHMQEYVDEFVEDEIGDLIGILNPNASKKVLITAHVDEIGLIVSNITSSGALQVITRGGVIPQTYPGQQVKISTQNGIIYGVVEATRDLLKKEDLKVTQFLIDIGAKDKEDAKAKVSVGDPVVLDTHIRPMANGRFSARALDDRLGVFIIMEALKRAKERDCQVGVYCGSTVGEETTKNGAYWTCMRVEPELAIVVDVTYTSDCQGMNEADAGSVNLGGGPVLCHSPIVAKSLNQKLKEVAEKEGIPYQMEVASSLSYTDADRIHFAGKGIPTVLVSIPLRYMHSPAEVADQADVENCIKLLVEFLCHYDEAIE